MQRKSHAITFGNPHRVKVLLYHRIVNEKKENDWANIAVTNSVFRRHIELLDKWGYTSVTFDDIRLFLDGKLNLPKKPVVITFDDAYEEIYSIAFPILQEFNMKAVVFVIGDHSIKESVWDEKRGPVYKLLTKEQIIDLHQAGYEIGSHSLTHPYLTEISRDDAWQEMLRSRMLLEILLNYPVRSFAYPYGVLNDSLKKMVAEAGYTVACASYSGPPQFGSDIYEIRRIKVIDSDSKLLFWLQLHPAYSYLRWIYWKLKLLLKKTGRKNTI